MFQAYLRHRLYDYLEQRQCHGSIHWEYMSQLDVYLQYNVR